MTLIDEKLIAEVKARPTLYDKKLTEYAQMDKRRALWKEVAEAVGGDANTCRKRWRSLRDAFLKSYRAIKDFPNGTATKKKKMWSYFDSMFFLVPFVEMDETIRNVAIKYIESAEQFPCTSNSTTEQQESDTPIIIESIFHISPENSTSSFPETSQGHSELEDSDDDEKYSNLVDTPSGDNDYTEAPKQQKESDEAYKKFLSSLEHDKNTELSVENFISEIRTRPLLYAKGLTDNRRHPERLSLWKEVAHATSLDVMSCKKRWRSLRDVFNKNYRALIDLPADKKKKMWPYFQKLFFLAPHLEAKESFQYAATKYSHLWQNEKQEPNLLDDTTNTIPPESGDSPGNIEELKKDEGTSDEACLNFRFSDPAKYLLLSMNSEKTSELSEEELIAAVKARPQLYTRGSNGSGQQNKRLKLWDEVASVVGEDIPTCKKRWKSLRDVFIRSHRAINSLSKYEALGKKKRWIHYKKLLFLIPYLGERDIINNVAMKPNQPTSDDTSEELHINGQLASTSAFLLPLHNTGEMLPHLDDTSKQPESHIQHDNMGECLMSAIKTESSSTFLNDTLEQTKPEIQFHKLRSCLVSLRRISVNVPPLLGGTSETLPAQIEPDEANILPDSLRNPIETSATLSEGIEEQTESQTHIDNVNPVTIKNISQIEPDEANILPDSLRNPIETSATLSEGIEEQTESQTHIDNVNPVTIKNISTNVFEKSQSQPESVNSPVNEIIKTCSPVNEHPVNLGNNPSISIREPYKRSIKRKLCDISEEKLLKILSYDDDPDKNFLLSLLPSLKRMTSRQNALARIKLQQVLFDVEFSETGRNVSDQSHSQSFVQSSYSPSSPSVSFHASDMLHTD